MKALSIRLPWAWLIIRPDVMDRDAREALIAVDALTWKKSAARRAAPLSMAMSRQIERIKKWLGI